MKLISGWRAAAAFFAAAVILAGCSSGTKGAASATKTPGPVASTAAPSPANTSGTSASHPAVTTKPTHGTPTATVATVGADYTAHAVPARAKYYHDARNPNAATRAAALRQLTNWFVNPARQAIIGQVAGWDRNYTVDIDVSHTVKITGGQITGDTATLQTIETWKVVTEGGPVVNQNGTSTTQEDNTHHTVHLKRYTNGWAVTSLA